MRLIRTTKRTFEEEAGAAFPTHWLREIYANLALHAFVAKTRAADLPSLTTFPEAETHIAVFNLMMRVRGCTSLDDFDRHYPAGNPATPMSGPNYGWYQLRFHVLAREIFDEGGEAALKRLWVFGQAEAAHRQRASDYFREHGTLSGWSEQTHAKDLAARLGAEVSPRLGHAIAAWHRTQPVREAVKAQPREWLRSASVSGAFAAGGPATAGSGPGVGLDGRGSG
jgi:hypothetical protein